MATKIYPVVHINETRQGVETAEQALECGANGIYLISHTEEAQDSLLEVYNEVITTHPNGYVGINFLFQPTAAWAFKLLENAVKKEKIKRLPSALWVDNAKLEADHAQELRSQPALAKVRYLGGIAFKYTDIYTNDPLAAAALTKLYAKYVDVITTSGSSTGNPPSAEKIAAMKEVAKELGKPLAVASGISTENLANYNGNIDEVLVSTSIETYPYSGVFERSKLKELIAEVKSLSS